MTTQTIRVSEGIDVELEIEHDGHGLVAIGIGAGAGAGRLNVKGKASPGDVFELSRVLRDAAIAAGALVNCECGHILSVHTNTLVCNGAGCSCVKFRGKPHLVAVPP